MTPDDARARLTAHAHGVLCTVHPDRGPDPVPVVYAVTDDGVVGVPVDAVKPKSSTRLRRERNLEADPRASLLVEHWDRDDWSRLWWVRAHLVFVPDPPVDVLDDLSKRLMAAAPQYADAPFHRVLALRIRSVSGWSALG
ncbi:pyridoxamine 5'-phosphate oxidase family protein [uncultured Williamsia sp.]|uniref:pyridoxamine 5'-phosphate oxidase family protein n=1 Tax=uncultured Williamsia sp. TaxID=259311 RepID=UPI0026227AF4|nr:pyridoxamine 5'-phosphate oxidase family protein [uncultured Williamsia sp.]